MERRLPFPQQLKYEREKRGWSQADLAEKVQSDCKTIQRWETGRSLPQPFLRQKLCASLGMNTEELGLVHLDKQHTSMLPATNRQDWGEAPLGSAFYGREPELAQLAQWIDEQHCQVVALLGIGGIGKTALATRIAEQLQTHFEFLFWRSLQDALPPERFLAQCLHCLAGQQLALPETVPEQVSLLLQYLQDHRCLLLLDNVESVLQGGLHAGQYQDGYALYGRLLRGIGETRHQSCLLLTSREKPREVALLEGAASPVRSLLLEGIGLAEATTMLEEKELVGAEADWTALLRLYSGNPLALKLVSQVIHEVFGGEIAPFLRTEALVFGDINELIDQQFRRLSLQEQEILFWLAIERETIGLEYLLADLVRPALRGEMLATVDSLCRRCLVEMRGAGQFTLQPVILEYVTGELIKNLCQEFLTEGDLFWTNYTFYKAQSKAFLRESQKRLILAPVVQQLLAVLGPEEIKRRADEILSTQRQFYPLQPHYLAGNILKLLLALEIDLRGTDFSHLLIRQVDLQDMALPAVNFAHAHFSSTVFRSTFGNVLTVALSPREIMLAMGTATGEIWIYHLLSGTPLMSYPGHRDGVWSVAFHPDARLLASGSDDQTIRLWSVSDGRCLHVLREHTNRVRAVTFSPDGRLLASGSDDTTARLWDAETGRCLRVLPGHTDRVWSVAFSPDGHTLATGSTDGTVRLWDVSSGTCLQVLPGHTGWVRSVTFHADGALLASGSDDRTVRLWDIPAGVCRGVLRGHANRIWSCAFSPDGLSLASGSEDQSIRVWDIQSYICRHVLHGHTHGVRSVAFSADGEILVSGGDDQAVRVWEVRTGSCLRIVQGYAKRIWSVALSGDGKSIVSSSEDQSIRLWDTSSGSCLKVFKGEAHRAKIAVLSPDGAVVASGGEDQAVRVWDVVTGRCVWTLAGHENWVRALAFHPDGRLLASGGEDHDIRLWDLVTARCIALLRGHQSWVRSLAFSPDGQFIASGSDDQTIRIWHTGDGTCRSILRGHAGRVRSVAFSPAGQVVASGGEDQQVYLWDVLTEKCLEALPGPAHWVRAVAFSPDGHLLAAGGDDPTLYVWDLAAEKHLMLLRGHTQRVRSLTFDPTGQRLVSGSDDGFIKLWSLPEGRCLTTFLHERPYEGMNITQASGLTAAQKVALQNLGAVDLAETENG